MIPPQFSAAIRAQGYDVAEVRVLSKEIQRDDRLILVEATRQKRVIITCNYSDRNSNFCLIHEEWRAKNNTQFGIVSFLKHRSAVA
jgi:hypothetical protein